MHHWAWRWSDLFIVLFYSAMARAMFFKARFIIRTPRNPDMTFQTWKKIQEAKKEIYSPIIAMIVIFTFIESLQWYQTHSTEFLQGSVERMGQGRAHALAAEVALGVGLLAAWYKRYDQYLYGWIEIVFGTVGGGVATAYISVGNFYATVVSFIGCIYVVTRGVDNILLGRSTEKQKEKEQKRLANDDRKFAEYKKKLRKKAASIDPTPS